MKDLTILKSKYLLLIIDNERKEFGIYNVETTKEKYKSVLKRGKITSKKTIMSFLYQDYYKLISCC